MAKFSSIKQHIYQKIESGEWPENHPVSSENALAQQFSVSRMTARRALQELADEGLVIRTQGSGTFVAPIKSQTSFMAIRNIADEIRSRGNDYRAKVHHLRVQDASSQVAEALALAPGSTVLHSTITHYENDVPVQLEERYVNPELVPDYLKQDFTKVTPHEYLCVVTPLTEASHQIEAIMPITSVCQFLSVDRHEPCLRIIRRTWSSGGVVSYALLTHPGSRFKLGGHLNFAGSSSQVV
ncbi:histidine utilization repressor [Idiomarina seosinensis]|uniref:Histidine utilization repressor n=1 Tax=Idiomarina seosinensis TaxID=281739 RepID=A0A432Z715_9GAMM|nr:histidine utilization repressor [Idiomarina seosinensis]RUO73623.1 histidine utilization repressor [Idiomarina seosinensis]